MTDTDYFDPAFLRTNSKQAEVLNQAIVLKHFLSNKAAIAHCDDFGIPRNITFRVLFQKHTRRNTDWK